MPMTVGNLRVYLDLDSSAYVKGLAQARTEGAHAERALGSFADTVANGVGRAAHTAAMSLGVLAGATVAYSVANSQTYVRAVQFEQALEIVGRQMGVNNDEIQAQIRGMTALGASNQNARDTVMQLMRARIDVTRATELYARAEDIAVTTGKTGNEVIQGLIHGITTQNALVLRNAGVTIDSADAMAKYAASIGKSTSELTAAEKQQAYFNAVMEQTAGIAGVAQQQMAGLVFNWAAMEAPLANLSEIMGSLFEPALSAVGKALFGLVNAFNAATKEGGALRPVIDMIREAAAKAAGPISELINWITEWIKRLDRTQVDNFANALKDWLPIIGAVAAALIAFSTDTIGKSLGPIGNLVPTIHPVIGAFVGLLLTMPELQREFGALLPVLAQAGKEFMQALMPALQALVPAFVGLVRAIVPLIPSIVQLATIGIQLLAPALAGIAWALAGLFSGIGWLVSNVPGLSHIFGAVALTAVALGLALKGLFIAQSLSATLAGLAQALGLQAITQQLATFSAMPLVAVMKALAAAILANPITWIVVALIALAGVFYLLYTRVEPFRNAVNAVGEALKNVGMAIWNALQPVFSWLGDVLNFVMEHWKAFAMVLSIIFWPISLVIFGIKQLIEHFGSIVEAVRTVAGAIGGFLGPIFSWIGDRLSFLVPVIEAVGAAFSWMGGAIAAAFGWLGPLVQWIGDRIHDVADFFQWLFDVIWGASILKDLVNGIKTAFDWISGIIGAFGAWIQGAWDWIAGVFVGAWNWIKDNIATIIPIIVGLIFGPLGALVAWIFLNQEQAKEIFWTAWNWISSTVGGIASAIWGFLVSIFTSVRDFFVSIWEGIKGIFSGAWNAIWSATVGLVSAMWNWVTDRFWQAVGWIANVMDEHVRVLDRIWTWIKDNTIGKVKELWDWVQRRWDESIGQIVSLLGGLRDKVLEIWENIKSGIAEKVSALWEWITGKIKDIIEAVIGPFKGLWEKLVGGSIVPDIVDGIVEEFQSIQPRLEDPMGRLDTFMGNVWGSIAESVGQTTEVAEAIPTAMLDVLAQLLQGSDVEALSAIMENLGVVMQTVWQAISDTIVQAAADVFAIVTNLFGALLEWVNTVFLAGLAYTMESSWTWIRDTVALLVADTGSRIQGLFQSTLDWMSGVFVPTLSSLLETAFMWIRDTVWRLVGELWNGVNLTLQLMWDWIGGVWIPGLSNIIESAFTMMRDLVIQRTTELTTVSRTLLDVFWAWVRDVLLPNLQYIFDSSWTWIKDTTVNHVTQMKEQVESVLYALRDSATHIMDQMHEWIVQRLDWIIGSINTWTDKVRTGLAHFGVDIPGDWNIGGMEGFARGGITDSPMFMVGERGRETIIPWESRFRGRALDLWMKTGQALGFMGGMGGPGGSLGHWWDGDFPMTQGPGGGFSHANMTAWDYSMPNGTPIKMGQTGELVHNPMGAGSGYGIHFGVNLDQGGSLILAHLQSISAANLSKPPIGEVVAYSDDTGFSTGPHMHIEVRGTHLTPGEGGVGGRDSLQEMLTRWAKEVYAEREVEQESRMWSAMETGEPPLLSGMTKDVIEKKAMPKMLEWLRTHYSSQLRGLNLGFGSEPWNGSGDCAEWVREGAKAAGVGEDWHRGLEIIAQGESTCNPNAEQQVNDINMARGDPARGLMQIIGQTFRAHDPGCGNPLDPICSVATAVRYIQSRYGHVNNTPGVRSVMSGGGYRGYDRGGMLPPGIGPVNSSGRPEMVLSNQTYTKLLSVLDRLDRDLGGNRGQNVTFENHYADTAVAQEVVSDVLIALRTL